MKPVRITQVEWFPTSEKPEYKMQMGGNPFALILIRTKGGSVFAGDYTDGWFCIYEKPFDEKYIAEWAYWPE